MSEGLEAKTPQQPDRDAQMERQSLILSIVREITSEKFLREATVESISGNAGENHRAISTYVDKYTGKIIAIGTMGKLSRNITENPQYSNVVFLQNMGRVQDMIAEINKNKKPITEEEGRRMDEKFGARIVGIGRIDPPISDIARENLEGAIKVIEMSKDPNVLRDDFDASKYL